MSDAKEELPGMPPPQVPNKITPEFWQAMLEVAAKSGLPVPAMEFGAPLVPTFALEWGWRRLGLAVGAAVRNKDVFKRSNELGTIDRKSGQWLKFDQRSFAGWLEEFVAFTWKGDKTPLIGEHAAMIMAQFVFRDQIRVVESINLIRVPVLRKNGDPSSLEFLPAGYDEQTKTFTAETLAYDMTWTVERSRDFLREHCEGFPWMRADWEEETTIDAEGNRWTSRKPLENNRSYSVHVAAMVGIYCRAMFEPGVLRPMLAYTANQQGSGKSVLVQMAITPVHGLVASSKMPKNDDELNKELESAAQAFAPFLFLDDIGHSMHSPPLNRFITSPRHAGRVLQTKDRFDVPAVTQVFATGNNVKGSRDLARRALIVELFYAGELKDRKLPFEISPLYLSRDSVRAGFLSSLCALVKHWSTAGEAERGILAKIQGLASFDEWSKLVAGIVMNAGYANPIAPPLVPMDEDEDQMKELLIAAATDEEKGKTFNRAELVELAREKELLEDVVGSKTDKEIDSKANKRFGKRLQIWRGRELVDGKNRRFRFGHKRQKNGATYPLEFL